MFRNPSAQNAVHSAHALPSSPETISDTTKQETAISTPPSLPKLRHPVLVGRTASGLWLHVGVLSCALLIGAGGLMSHARQAGNERENLQAPLLSGQIACVDMDRVYAASGGPEQLAQRANEIAVDINTRLKELKTVSMLDESELQEYGAITFKATKTDADQARQKALRALSDQRQDELNKLQIKPDNLLTAEDKTRMKQLQEQSRLLASILPYWQDDARAQQAERLEAFRRAQMAKLRQTVGKVAAERNVAHVFDTSALVYSANDLTALVLTRVGKRAPKDNKADKADKAGDSKDKDSPDKDVKDKATP